MMPSGTAPVSLGISYNFPTLKVADDLSFQDALLIRNYRTFGVI